MHRLVRNTITVIPIIILCPFLATTLLVASLYTESFSTVARHFLIKTANRALDANLHIRDVTITFPATIRLVQPALTRKGKNIASADYVLLKPSLTKLLFRHIDFEDITLSKPIFFVRSDSSGLFELETLVKPTSPPARTGRVSRSAWHLSVSSVAIDDGTITVVSRKRSLSVNAIQFKARVDGNLESLTGSIDDLTAELRGSKLALNKCSVDFTYRQAGTLEFSNLRLVTGGSEIQADGSYSASKNRFRLMVHAPRLSLDEARSFYPIGFEKVDSIRLSGVLTVDGRSLVIEDLVLSSNAGQVTGTLLTEWGPNGKAAITVGMRDLQLAKLLDPAFDAVVSGTASLNTDSWDHRLASGNGSLNLSYLRIDRFRFSSVTSTLSFSPGRITLEKMDAVANAGSGSFDGWIDSQGGSFLLNGFFFGLDPAKLFDNPAASGSLNLTATVKGKVLPPSAVQFSMAAAKSTLMGEAIDRLEIQARVTKDSVRVSKAQIETPFCSILANGDVDLSSQLVSLAYDLNVNDAPRVLDLLGVRDSIPHFELVLSTSGQIVGQSNDLNVDGKAFFSDLNADTFSFASMALQYRLKHLNATLPFAALLADSLLLTELEAEVKDLRPGNLPIVNTIGIGVVKEGKLASLDLKLVDEKTGVAGHITGSLRLTDNRKGRFDLKQIDLSRRFRQVPDESSSELPGIVSWSNEKPAVFFLDFENHRYAIDELSLIGTGGRISLAATVDLPAKRFDGTLTANLPDLSSVETFIPYSRLPEVANGLNTTAAVKVHGDTLSLRADFFAGQLNHGSYQLDSLILGCDIQNLDLSALVQALSDPDLEGWAAFSCSRVSFGSDSGFQNMRLKTSKSGDHTTVSFGVDRQNEILADLFGTVVVASPGKGKLQIDRIYLDPRLEILQLAGPSDKAGQEPAFWFAGRDSTVRERSPWQNLKPIRVDFDLNEKHFDIRDCALEIEGGVLKAEGSIRLDGEQDLTLNLVKMKVESIAHLTNFPVPLTGSLSLNAALSGPPWSPQISADWSVVGGALAGVGFREAEGSFHYQDKHAVTVLKVYQDLARYLELNASVPVDLSFRETTDRFTGSALDISVYSEEIDLRFLQPFFEDRFKIVRGDMTVSLSIAGDDTRLIPSGTITLKDGEILFPAGSLNQTFSKINMKISADEKQIIFTDLSVQSGKKADSRLTARGFIDISALAADYENTAIVDLPFNFQTTLKDFVPIRAKSESQYLHTAQISGLATVSGGRFTEPNITGNVSLKNSEFWVPDKPRSLENVDKDASGDVFNNLVMDVRILMDENGFNSIRSKDLRLDFFGDVTLGKQAGNKNVDVGGDVFLKRGGKVTYWSLDFRIAEGKIAFKPGASANPDIDLIATRNFRYDGGKQQAVAQIVVSGTLLQPVVAVQAVDKATGFPIESLSTADIVNSLISGQSGKDLDASKVAAQFVASTAVNTLLSNVAEELGFETLEYTPAGTNQPSLFSLRKRVSRRVSVGIDAVMSGSGSKKYSVEYDIPADSTAWVPQTLEGNYETGSGKVDVFNLIFFWKKEY